MQLPFFYIRDYDSSQKKLQLDEETSRHVVSVLRMKTGQSLNLTDGNGSLFTAVILNDHKKHCEVGLEAVSREPRAAGTVSIGISLLKNASRFEWFLEKATEIGVAEIIPLICERTERQKFRIDRMKQICISAMLQSQQCWLPELKEPVQLANLQMVNYANALKFIAHCMDGDKPTLTQALYETRIPNSQSPLSHSIILIGPEGDFTATEIEHALRQQFKPVSLGSTRLRSETAGIVAAVFLKNA